MDMGTFSSSELSFLEHGFKHYCISVVNFERAVKFYDTLFESLEYITDSKSGIKRYCLKKSRVFLELRHAVNTRTRQFYDIRKSNLSPVSIQVMDKETVDELYNQVLKLNNLSIRKPRYYTIGQEEQYTFYFNDFEGVSIEIHS
jgi:hypothetical protein